MELDNCFANRPCVEFSCLFEDPQLCHVQPPVTRSVASCRSRVVETQIRVGSVKFESAGTDSVLQGAPRTNANQRHETPAQTRTTTLTHTRKAFFSNMSEYDRKFNATAGGRTFRGHEKRHRRIGFAHPVSRRRVTVFLRGTSLRRVLSGMDPFRKNETRTRNVCECWPRLHHPRHACQAGRWTCIQSLTTPMRRPRSAT